jgi:hypothetical protein
MFPTKILPALDVVEKYNFCFHTQWSKREDLFCLHKHPENWEKHMKNHWSLMRPMALRRVLRVESN